MTPPTDLTPMCRGVAARVVDTLKGWGFAPDYDDALAGAMFGAWRAEESWEPGHGTRKSTWAYPWIKRYAEIEARKSAGLTSRGDGPHLYSLDEVPDGITDMLDVVDVRDAVSRLPEREREVVFRTYWLGEGPTAVGKHVGLSKSGASVVLKRAHQMLRDSLS